MMRRRAMAVMAGAVLLAALFSGCGNTAPGESGAADPASVDMAEDDSGDEPGGETTPPDVGAEERPGEKRH